MCDTHSSSDGQVPGSVTGKLTLLRALAGHLAREDWASLPAPVQDEAIRILEQAEAAQAAIRGAALAAISDGPVLSWYGQQSVTSYLVAETRVTRPAARGHQAWAKRHGQHPQVMDALARMDITAPVAAKICGWSGVLPQEHQAMADEILLGAWLGGCTEGDLAMLARQMREELDPDHDGKPPAPGLTVDTTIDGASVLHGDLAPGVTALVKAAFEKYAVKQGPEDHRTLAERQHDALGQICRQVLTPRPQPVPVPAPAAGHTPDSDTACGDLADGDLADAGTEEEDDGLFAPPATPAGTTPAGTTTAGTTADGNGTGGAGQRDRAVTALVHINMADLLSHPQASTLTQGWIRTGTITWAGENARNATEPGYGGAWLTGTEARAITQDASITPIVTATPDTSVIPQLAAAGARLHALLQDEQAGDTINPQHKQALAADLLGHAIKALSGPGGFASYLRTRLFAGTVLGSGSLVLDVGRQRHIPRQLRITIAVRDRTCSWPGCSRTAIQSQPHHVQHYADGGTTSPDNLKTCCWAHHNIVLHRDGWHGTMHPDGTIDLHRPDGTRYTPGTRYQPPQRE